MICELASRARRLRSFFTVFGLLFLLSPMLFVLLNVKFLAVLHFCIPWFISCVAFRISCDFSRLCFVSDYEVGPSYSSSSFLVFFFAYKTHDWPNSVFFLLFFRRWIPFVYAVCKFYFLFCLSCFRYQFFSRIALIVIFIFLLVSRYCRWLLVWPLFQQNLTFIFLLFSQECCLYFVKHASRSV